MVSKTKRYKKGGELSSKTKRNNIARTARNMKNNSIKLHNRSSIFHHGFSPEKIIRHGETKKLVNERTKKPDFRNKRFIRKSDEVKFFLSPKFSRIEPDFKDLFDGLKRNDIHTDEESFVQEASDLYHFSTNSDNNFCKGEINEKYLFESIVDYSHAMLILRRGQKILGFATMNFKEESIYIPLICSGDNLYGAGQMMVDYLVSIAKILNYSKITLGSIKLDDTIKFYLKNGFTFDNSNDTDCVFKQNPDDKYSNENGGECAMTKILIKTKSKVQPRYDTKHFTEPRINNSFKSFFSRKIKHLKNI